MPTTPIKAQSVTASGEPDGFTPPAFYRGETLPEGVTRLTISVPMERLPAVHAALIATLEAPLGVLYNQMVHRQSGVQHPHGPKRFVGVGLGVGVVREALARCQRLLYADGRAQLWVRGGLGDQVILDELGVLFAYPDDPLTRSVLDAHGIPEGQGQTMGERDYVKGFFLSEADAEEEALLRALSLQPFPSGGH